MTDVEPYRRTERIVVTGAAGLVGSLVRPLLRRPGRVLVLVDIAEVVDAEAGLEEVRQVSVLDSDAVLAACQQADLVVHLGGLSKEDGWQEILQTNVHGTYVVLDSARRAGVRRVLIASSLHAVGYLPMSEAGNLDVPYPRPDTFYGFSKAAVEALGSLFADRYAMSIVSARLGTVTERITSARALSTWLSPADLARLVEVCLRRDEPGHHVIWAMSANTRGVVSLAAGEAIGFVPRDDAEDQLEAERGAIEANPEIGERLGASWAGEWPLGEKMVPVSDLEDPTDAAPSRTVKSAERTLMVLQTLGEAREPLTVVELHRRTGYPRSSLHQLLHTMIAMGWLERTTDGTMVGIGSRALLVGTAYLDRDRALGLGLRALENVRSRTGFTAHYARLEGNRVIYLATREAFERHRAVSRIGRQLPAHATALGKVLLSELTEAEVTGLFGAVLPALTPNTITDLARLQAELEVTRQRGHAVEHEENTEGTACVAVAVPYRIPATDAISCSIPIDHASDPEMAQVAEILTAEATGLAAQLRARGVR